MLNNIFAVGNIICGFVIAYYSLINFRKNCEPYKRWLWGVRTALGIYWAGIYLFVITVEPANAGIDPVTFGRIFVRPATLLTLATIASAAILGAKNK